MVFPSEMIINIDPKEFSYLRLLYGFTSKGERNFACIFLHVHDLLFSNPSCELANNWSQAGSGVSGGNTMGNSDILNRNLNSCSLKEAKT